jgi:NADH dehydrogenase [ubiquinone] 1 alpha subcomplex assembly factor 5
MPSPFDPRLRQLRRDRAARSGPALFLLERAFDDCLERLEMTGERFSEALLLGCPDPAWPGRLAPIAERVAVADPGPLFAARAGGQCAAEEQLDVEPGSFDLILAIGTLDTAAALPDALLRLALALRPGALLLGALSGGDTLPRLRAAMRAADELATGHAAHVHPRIEASALAGLLGQCGLQHAVVDVDRVPVRYASFHRLVADLRAMSATNILAERAPPLNRAGRAAAAAAFECNPVETFELLHFAARRG